MYDLTILGYFTVCLALCSALWLGPTITQDFIHLPIRFYIIQFINSLACSKTDPDKSMAFIHVYGKVHDLSYNVQILQNSIVFILMTVEH